jgi:DNA polymerase III subunit alpha
MSKTPSRFVGLHSHSGFSVFDGMGYPQEHIDFVLENGMDAWALTDHGHMNGFAHAYLHAEKVAKEKNFKLIPGCEMYVHPDLDAWQLDYQIARAEKYEDQATIDRLKLERQEITTPLTAIIDSDDEIVDIEINKEDQGITIEDEDTTKSSKFYDPIKRRHHLVVLPKNSRGLERLFGLVSRGYLEGFYRFPRVDYKMIKEAARDGDLMVSSACLGGPLCYEVFRHLQQIEFDELHASLLDDPHLMDKILNSMSTAYGGLVEAVGQENVMLELQFNKLPAQHLVNRAIIALAEKEGAKDNLVVTCDSHYANPDHWRERELYKKLGWLNYKEFDPDKLPKSKDELKCELYPKNAKQVWETYKETTEGHDFYDDVLVCDAIERTHDVAHEMIGEIHADQSPKLPSWVVPEGSTATKTLIDLCKKGLVKRGFADNPEYVARLKHELKIIIEREFELYFLAKHELITIAKEHMLVGPGRGSGAGSLVNYVLDITDVDPIKYDLLFERFLSKYRQEYPDIDTDIADRDRLIEILSERFDENCVIPISNYNTFKLKALIKDVSRFYGIPFEEQNKATRTVEQDVRKATMKHGEDKNLFVLTYDDAMEHSPSFREYIEKYPEVGEPIKVLFKQNKSLGRHAGGVIICDKVAERMPLILAKGKPQTPWVEGVNFKHLEEFGWIKFDLLGLETLRVIERTIDLILQRHHGIEKPTFADVKKWYDENLAPDSIDFDDQYVYEQIYHKGRFAGIFQLTSKGAQKLFMQAKPRGIIDIATLTSVYRPGPLAAGVHKLVLKHADGEPYKWGHPLINKVLEKTNGMIIFQESVMQLAHEVAGFPLDECDKVRKAIMKRSISGGEAAKKKALELRKTFVEGSVNNGVPRDVADDLYDKILFFAGYGFNKAHALSYAMDSYFCAWLMTYYEEEWLCAYLESMSGNDKKRATAFNEVRKLGYKIDPIDINYAEKSWTILEGKRFMPSFMTCKSVGEAAVDEIMRHRPYTSVEQMLWDEEHVWKPSKFNKRTLEALIKIKAFDSMDIVGPNKTFESYKQMHEILIEKNSDLRKRTKKDPERGKNFFKQYLLETDGIGEWSKIEYAENLVNYLGSCNASSVAPKQLMEKMAEMEISPIDDHHGKDIYWFIVTDVKPKKTKNGKPYLLLTVSGDSGVTERMFMWGWKKPFNIPKYSLCLAEVDKSDFGLSTTQWKVKILS